MFDSAPRLANGLIRHDVRSWEEYLDEFKEGALIGSMRLYIVVAVQYMSNFAGKDRAY